MLDRLNEFHLKYIPTSELEVLKTAIRVELSSRRKLQRKESDRLIAESPSMYVDMTLPEVEEHNRSRILAIPGHRVRKAENCTCFLDSLINQDWSHLFYGGDETRKYYVYAHIDPTKQIFHCSDTCGGNWGGQPFYIGKGTGNRAYELDRNQGHRKIIRSLKSSGVKDSRITKIIFSELTEAKAFEIEAKLIYFFGTIYDTKTKRKGLLYNLNIPNIPVFEGEMIDYRAIESKVEDYTGFKAYFDLWLNKHPLATDEQQQLAMQRIAKKFSVNLLSAAPHLKES